MRALRLAALAVALGGLLTACKGAKPVGTPSEELDRATTFPHEKHAAVDCTDCHTGIAKAASLGQPGAIPTVEKCKECHDLDAMTPADRAAHSPPAREATAHAINFDHAGHLTRIKAKAPSDACATCHTPELLPEPGPARHVVPSMSTCTACHHHEVEVAEARCQPCHESLRRYPMKPIAAVAGLSHQGNFVKTHGKLVKSSAATCAQCHDQTYCAKCHANATVPFRPEVQFPERVQADFIHRGDYVSRHQVEAAADPASCRKCHGSNFCDSCHTAQNLSARNAAQGGSPHNPHPAGWTTPGSSQFHGAAARQNIVTCAGCHDQPGPQNTCVRCHASRGPGLSGIGGNPHPAGYNHSRGDIQKNSMCLACHQNG